MERLLADDVTIRRVATYANGTRAETVSVVACGTPLPGHDVRILDEDGRPLPERHIGEGSFFVRDDRTICQSIGGQGEPVVYGGTTLRADGTLTGKRLASLGA